MLEMRNMLLDLLRRAIKRQRKASVGTLPASADRARWSAPHCSGWGLPIVLLAMLFGVSATAPALAVPSFAIQTGQPCAACHIGAFGPQLTPYGMDFTLPGYTASEGKDH